MTANQAHELSHRARIPAEMSQGWDGWGPFLGCGAASWETSDAGPTAQGLPHNLAPLCGCAALGLQQALLLHVALLRKWKEALGMQSNPCICWGEGGQAEQV